MSKWISVKDRLPEENRNVIIYGGLGRYSDGLWYSMTGEDSNRLIQWEVTHWQPLPLPEPPEDIK